MKIMLNTDAMKRHVERAISKFGQQIDIKRSGKNEFGEPSEGEVVATVKGYSHKGNSGITFNVSTAGQVVGNRSEYLLVVFDENAALIKTGDFFEVDETKEIKYEIVDLGNCMDVYMDMKVQRK